MSAPSLGYQDASSSILPDSFSALSIRGGVGSQAEEEQFDARRLTLREALTIKADRTGFTVADKPSRFFGIGRVFKTLWIEPAGSTATDTDQRPYHTVGYGQQQLAYAKVRRFVVIRKRLHSCLCLMISTYGGQGAAKEDARSQDHAVVYSSQFPEPLPRPGENITFGSFPVIIEEPGEVLGVMSRLDFGKVYTVEHNVKVLRIGRIWPDQIKRLNECFAMTMGLLPLPDELDPTELEPQQDDPIPTANNSTGIQYGTSVPSKNLRTSSVRYATSSPRPESQQRFIRSTSSKDEEKMDVSFYVRNRDYKRFFRIGRIFGTLWTEGVGSSAHQLDQTFLSEVVYKETVFSKVRRFVVVREGDRSCTCLPVTSYDGQGHRKRGIQLEDHGFIYSRSKPSRVERMRPKALKVVLSRGADFRDPMLVNYGKVYNVETNVKVKDIGDLDAESKAVLVQDFRHVFLERGGDTMPYYTTPRSSEALLAGVGGGLETYGGSFAASSEYNTAPSYYSPASHIPPEYNRGALGSIQAPAYDQSTTRYSTSQPNEHPPITQTYGSPSEYHVLSVGYDDPQWNRPVTAGYGHPATAEPATGTTYHYPATGPRDVGHPSSNTGYSHNPAGYPPMIATTAHIRDELPTATRLEYYYPDPGTPTSSYESQTFATTSYPTASTYASPPSLYADSHDNQSPDAVDVPLAHLGGSLYSSGPTTNDTYVSVARQDYDSTPVSNQRGRRRSKSRRDLRESRTFRVAANEPSTSAKETDVGRADVWFEDFTTGDLYQDRIDSKGNS